MDTTIARQTSNHHEIQQWAAERNAQPAVLNETTNDNVIGVLRIKFPESTDARLKVISWEEFFREFDENGMMFIYHEDKNDHYYSFVYLDSLPGEEDKVK